MNAQAQAVLDGNRRALARLLTDVENEREGTQTTLAHLFPHTGRAHIVGVTGAPGTGKSTLATALVAAYRREGRTVAVLAVDPTSPFTGGAILGDRVRMGALAGDRGVFIRSMATRGSLGGLARTAPDAIRVLDAAGFDVVLVETVGAGQSEVAVAGAAQTTVVVEAPGLGDGVQAIKAGILEIADVLVVNKADRPGVHNTVRGLRTMIELGHPTKRAHAGHHGVTNAAKDAPPPDEEAIWVPPIVQTVATDGTGIDDLLAQINAHRDYLHRTQTDTIPAATLRNELLNRIQAALLDDFLAGFSSDDLDRLIARLQARTLSPSQAVTEALQARQRSDTNHEQHPHTQ